MSHARPFHAEHYETQIAGSRQSAAIVLPLVFDLLRPASVLDVGCGAGTWLAAAAELGVRDIAGIEGGNPSDADLQVPRDTIRRFDLCNPVDLRRTYDLTMSLEVAEHIPSEDVEAYLTTVTCHSNAVLFSAAAPGQRGHHHVNEQWPTYWSERFADRGFLCFDPLRSLLWNDEGVEWWYRQNLLIFAKADAADRLESAGYSSADPLCLVHPTMYEAALEPVGIRESAKLLGNAVKLLGRAVKSRLT